ncbi:MAG: glycosyltransferase family 2 protein [Spirochaetes bacterium]|nr:glycosyltransferase family 2 protein [Spirochaetota bacterium]MBN2769572.1 glycosyltransferase family 2 protein [Spirochaetota bacterium]
MASVSIVVPAYKEAQNIPVLVERLYTAFDSSDHSCSVIIVDDDSMDGTVEAVSRLKKKYPVQLHVRTRERGLSSAVLAGFALSKGDIFICMDADLSHPPEKTVEMCDLIEKEGADFVIGSRNVAGGSADSFNLYRKLNAFVSRMLARPLAKTSDPMAGFFAFRSSLYTDQLVSMLNPVGWKICLEILVKMKPENVREIPIVFAERLYGESKLSLKEQINYLVHLKRLYYHKFKGLARFMVFSVVGASGIVVDLTIVFVVTDIAGAPFKYSRIAGIAGAMTTNFILNRYFTFEERPARNIFTSYVSFALVCSLGAALNWYVSMKMHSGFGMHYIIASLTGIVAGTFVNYAGSTLLVFRK